MYKRKDQDPPCVGCLPPLNPENEDAVRVYSFTRDQLIFAGMSGTPIGIDHSAVWKFMDEAGDIEDRMGTFEKVLILAQQEVKRMRMKMEGDSPKHGAPKARIIKPGKH